MEFKVGQQVVLDKSETNSNLVKSTLDPQDISLVAFDFCVLMCLENTTHGKGYTITDISEETIGLGDEQQHLIGITDDEGEPTYAPHLFFKAA